jgi:2,3-diketo-5-methylthio-1-phosphopentane phosphatase
MKDIQFFCDFDGTITKEDTLNKFLQTYADKKWLEIEDQWIRKEIGSKVCIQEQMKLFPKMEVNEIEKFTDSIEIDETFLSFLEYLKAEKIDFYIVSDGFDFFIKSILEKNGIDTDSLNIFSNKLTIQDGKFITEFPYCNNHCKCLAGMCKCRILELRKIVTKRTIYAGDGLSDFCASGRANVLFAKGSLLEYCKNTKNDNFIAFKSFEEIINYIKLNE